MKRWVQNISIKEPFAGIFDSDYPAANCMGIIVPPHIKAMELIKSKQLAAMKKQHPLAAAILPKKLFSFLFL